MKLNGQEEPDWVFSLSALPDDYIVSIALAPAEQVDVNEVCH